MKAAKPVLLFAVCTILAFSLIIFCDRIQPSLQDDNTATRPDTAPTTPADPLNYYATAAEDLRSAGNLSYCYTFNRSRTAGNETYCESRSGSALYSGLNTNEPEALLLEDVTYDSYNAHFTEAYRNGRAYAQVRGSSFVCDLTADAFLSRQVPAVLLDHTLYSQVQAEGLTYSFFGARALESWVDPTGQAALISAAGTATMDADGRILLATYEAEYMLGTVRYRLSVSVDLTAQPEATAPEFPENCAVISDLEILRMMLQAVNGVYSTDSVTSDFTETIQFGLLQETRSTTGSYCFHDSGADFLARLVYENVRTAVGGTTTSSQNNIFRDGQYLCSINGDEPFIDGSYNADNLRVLCEDSILSSMITPEYISGAQITDNGDFWVISFDGNDAYIQHLGGKIDAAMGLNVSLDLQSESCSTETAGGYLIVNRYTGLPVAMGLSLERTHVINGVSFSMAFHRDQSLTLSCPDAFETITGEAPEPTQTATITPPFFRVTGENGQQMWLMGTLDVGDDRTCNLPQQILDALAGSDALAVEYDPEDFTAAVSSDPALLEQLLALYCYGDGTTAEHLPEDLYARLYPFMLATGLNSTGSNRLTPMVWAGRIENLYLSQSYCLSAMDSCEARLLALAREKSMPIYQMESGLDRARTLTGLSEELQIRILRYLLEQGIIAYNSDALLEYTLWCSGDLEGLSQQLTAATSGLSDEDQAFFDAYDQAFLSGRTELMCSTAVGYLESGETVFFCVSTSNLLGEAGLPEALRAAGYTVEAVSYQ